MVAIARTLRQWTVMLMSAGWKTGWIIGVARKTDGRIDAEEYGVAIPDMSLALNAVRRLVGRAPETHVWGKEPMLGEGEALEPGAIHRRDAETKGAEGFELRRLSR
jgi:hypothetical protein